MTVVALMRSVKTVSALLLVLLVNPGPALAGPQRRTPANPPKLVVLLVVDEMRADYVDQFGRNWKKGLRRLFHSGSRFTQAAYPYWNTVTCPGHSTIGTGTFPATHGMILNAWWDRAAGKQVNCTDDAGVSTVTSTGTRPAGQSPKNLRAATLADEMRAQLGPTTRVVTLSLKARSAIGLAGHGGDAAVWFSGNSWTTSTFYGEKLPEFVQRYEREHSVEASFGKPWTKLLRESAYQYSDDAAGEIPPSGGTRTFPHAISTVTDWINSPFPDVALGELAEGAVNELHLGQGQGTDFLGVSFSALDEVGHDYGLRSHEVQDVLARLDVTIGKLLDFLDRAVGRKNYVVALTADHGVAPIPEQARAEGKDAGRITTNDFAGVGKVLESYFGPGQHIQRILYTEMYLAPGIYAKLKANPEAMRRVKEEILKVPGVWRVYQAEELEGRKADRDPATRAAALSYFPERSGDLIILSKQHWLMSTAATTHGTGHPYDVRVPVILMGSMFRPGKYRSAATPADIALTLANIVGIEMPQADGRVLSEAMRAMTRASATSGEK